MSMKVIWCDLRLAVQSTTISIAFVEYQLTLMVKYGYSGLNRFMKCPLCKKASTYIMDTVYTTSKVSKHPLFYCKDCSIISKDITNIDLRLEIKEGKWVSRTSDYRAKRLPVFLHSLKLARIYVNYSELTQGN